MIERPVCTHRECAHYQATSGDTRCIYPRALQAIAHASKPDRYAVEEIFMHYEACDTQALDHLRIQHRDIKGDRARACYWACHWGAQAIRLRLANKDAEADYFGAMLDLFFALCGQP